MTASNKHALVELARGFHIHSTAPELFYPITMLQSDNHWDVLGALLVRAQHGDFSELNRIADLLCDSSQSLFWHAAIELFSLASSWNKVLWLEERLEHKRKSSTTQYFLAIMFGNTCDLRATEALLRLHRESDTDEVRYEVERNLSHLLEPINGALWYGADETEVEYDESSTDDGIYSLEIKKENYAATVRKTRDALANRFRTNVIFGAEPFAVTTLVNRLSRRLTENEVQFDRIFHERMILEASTGIDSSGFFDPTGKLAPLQASAIIEDLLESDLSGFSSGLRYFFGHPIPD